MKFTIFSLLTIFTLGTACRQASNTAEAYVAFVKGQVNLTRGDKSTALKSGNALLAGDKLTTGAGAAAIIEYRNFQGKLEVQENTSFIFRTGGKSKEVFLENGNIWTQVTKLGKGEDFLLRTPTTVAGVRGTKFFTFYSDNLTGTCHCEGKIEYTNTKTGKSMVNNKDYLVVYKGDKSVILDESDFKLLKLKSTHNHSSLDDSPVGKKDEMTPEEKKRFHAYIEEKLAALK